ncbi:MAG TPA: hypothetical protein PKX10_01705 [Propioniciclava tarda]|nr:hypothetical protein [Propioniciclava tarda]HQA30124.1 hypothetical protein [Propioniciclava tarda]HQD60017.1 hypothetical protein [Propioniciclava tarda]
MSTSDFTGTVPDYFGAVLVGTSGTLAANVGGKRHAASDVKMTVSADKKTVHAEDTSLGGAKLVADVTCG